MRVTRSQNQLVKTVRSSCRTKDNGTKRRASREHSPQTKRLRDHSPTEKSITKYSLLACGSFNPITNMHLRMFEIAKDYVKQQIENAEVIQGIISPVSDGYAKKGLESSLHRTNMCSLAISSNPWLEISTWESKRKNWTPTIEVLSNVSKALIQQNNPSQLMLLCGSDLLESFNVPGLWRSSDIKTILQKYGLLVINRPGYDSEHAIETNEILSSFRSKIHIAMDMISNDTSSTSLRKFMRDEKSVRYLTPDSVIEYMKQNNLYSSQESENKNSDVVLAPFVVNKKKL